MSPERWRDPSAWERPSRMRAVSSFDAFVWYFAGILGFITVSVLAGVLAHFLGGLR